MSIAQSATFLQPEILAYYQKGKESQRLLNGIGQLEFARTQEIISRHLPPSSAVIYDIGGGPGLYACWLAQLGNEVHLVDAMPLHIEQAQVASRLQPEYPIATCTLGDARHIERPDESVDIVLLLGPLYHLIEYSERVAALREARRILKPGGVLFAAVISHFATALDGLVAGMVDDPDFIEIVKQDIQSGQHRNPYSDRDYFTTAYLHYPQELKSEVEEAELQECQLLALEGVGWLLPDLVQRWQDSKWREMLLMMVRHLETEPSLMGVSRHIMAVARK